MAVANKSSWKTCPMPDKTSTLDYKAEFTTEEFAKISRGLIPKAMEEKWFMYVDGGTLYIHRSWTGICIYTVDFLNESGVYKVKKAVVNRDPEQYKATDDNYNAQLLDYLINRIED